MVVGDMNGLCTVNINLVARGRNGRLQNRIDERWKTCKTFGRKNSIINVWQGPKYVLEYFLQSFQSQSAAALERTLS